jgi:hypothetical protein
LKVGTFQRNSFLSDEFNYQSDEIVQNEPNGKKPKRFESEAVPFEKEIRDSESDGERDYLLSGDRTVCDRTNQGIHFFLLFYSPLVTDI